MILLGRIFRRIRRHEKITQEQVAQSAGVSESTIKKIEKLDVVPYKYIVALNALLPGLNLLDEEEVRNYYNKLPIIMERKPRTPRVLNIYQGW